MLNCIVCNKRLEDWFEGECCSDKCRKKKSRDKLMALPRAYAMGFQIDNFTKMLNNKTITAAEARALLEVVWDRLGNFYELVKEAEQKAERISEGEI